MTQAVVEGTPRTVDRPHRVRRATRDAVAELVGSAVAAAGLMWLVFTLTGTEAPFGLGVSIVLTFFTFYGILTRLLHGPLVMKDRLATVAVWGGSLVALVPLVGVIGYVILKGGAVVLGNFPGFFLKDMANLSATATPNQVGAGAAIVGSLEQLAIATVVSVPIGVLTATYLADHDTVFAKVVGYVVDAMTGSPAIIAGLFVYLLWVVPHGVAGKSGLACGLALSVMMLPIVTRTAQEVISIVPGALREASYALGSPQWRAVLRVVLPTARAGLVTAVILGVARVAGETAPVLFVAGGSEHYNWNPFSGQQDNLPFRVYQLIFQSGEHTTEMAWGVSFVLIIVILILFILARLAGASRPGRAFTLQRRSKPGAGLPDEPLPLAVPEAALVVPLHDPDDPEGDHHVH